MPERPATPTPTGPTPEPPQSLTEALVALQAQLPRIPKTGTGQVGPREYKYAPLDVVTEALFPIMAALGLTWICYPDLDEDGKFVLGYELKHLSHEAITGRYPLPASGTPQQIGSAITYARRYALLAVTGAVPAGEDDDGQAAEAGAQADLAADAAGTMTRAQRAEHAELRRHDHPRPAERSHDQAEDQWTDQPAGKFDAPAEDQPGSSIPDHHRRIGMLYSQLGITDRDQRLTDMRDRLARDISSSKDLSFLEAERAIKELADLIRKEGARR